MGDPWVSQGRAMGEPRENHGLIMAEPWVYLG